MNQTKMVRTDYPTAAGQRSERGRVWFFRRSPCGWTPGQRALEQGTGQAAPDLEVGRRCARSSDSTRTCVPHEVPCWVDGRRHVARMKPDPGRAQRRRNRRAGRRRPGACCPAGPAEAGPDPALLGHRLVGVPWSLGRVAGRVAPGHRRRRLAGPRGLRRRRRCGDGHRRGVGARLSPAASRLARPHPHGVWLCLRAASLAARREVSVARALLGLSLKPDGGLELLVQTPTAAPPVSVGFCEVG